MPRTRLSSLDRQAKIDLETPAHVSNHTDAKFLIVKYFPARNKTTFQVRIHWLPLGVPQMLCTYTFGVAGKHDLSGFAGKVTHLQIEYVPHERTTIGRITLETGETVEVRHRGRIMRCIG